MAEKIKWGVIGCGGIAARRTIPEFKTMVSNARIVSVMGMSPNRAKEVAERFDVTHSCDTVEELLEQDIDAVYIATPQNVHCRQTVQAAKAGKHILCEKPIAVTVAEVEQMQAACDDAGVKFMLAWCMRQNVYNRKARELVQAGQLGKMVMGRAQLTCWYPPIPGAWRQDVSISHGGSLLDMGTHCLDMLEWIMDARIVEVTGFQDMLVQDYPTQLEDTSTIVVRFDNGAQGIVDNYFNLPDAAAQNALELHGTKGSIIAKGTMGQDPTGEMFSIIQPQETGYDANQIRDIEVDRQEYQFEGIGLYGQMITIFSDSILNDTQPEAAFESGFHSVKIVNAVYQAVKEKKVVAVEE